MKKPLFLFIITCCLSLHGFSQSKAIKKLYTLYDSREFVKCVEHADKIIKKNEHELEAYYVKAIAYFEMAQLPQRYKDFTNDPLLECLRALTVIRTKDSQSEIFEENEEKLALIYNYSEYVAEQLKSTNQEKAIVLYQRLMRAYRVQTGALDLAIIYAKVGNYEQCMRQVSRLYDKSPENITSSHENYQALTEGALLLANYWMFRDLFWLVTNYKSKYETNYAISAGFKKAVLLSIDTAKNEEEKNYFYDFSKQGLGIYKDDAEFVKHVETQWLDVIDKEIDLFKNTDSNSRTWKDTIYLRNAAKYIRMSRELFPESANIAQAQKKFEISFHLKPLKHEQAAFQEYALRAINTWRNSGCQCDTGRVIRLRPVYQVDWDTTLTRLAQSHAESMFANNFTNNIDAVTGENPWDRVNSTHLRGQTVETLSGTYYIKALQIGEVLGHGFALGSTYELADIDTLVQEVVESWITTRFSQNCPKIMTAEFSHMGLAVYGDKWVLLFAQIHDITISRK
ncbi:MAG: hypothetical protein GX277_07715 [Bacteroidales bacterium]|nr:hypothetical protein [Bacteroidales bacterium]